MGSGQHDPSGRPTVSDESTKPMRRLLRWKRAETMGQLVRLRWRWRQRHQRQKPKAQQLPRRPNHAGNPVAPVSIG